MFDNKPTVAFKRNKVIQNLIGSHLIKNGKIAQKKLVKQEGQSRACNTTRSSLWFIQVVNTNILKSNETECFQRIPCSYMQKSMDYPLIRIYCL